MHNGTAAVFDPGTRRFEVRSYPVAAPEAGFARLALLYSGICGTDLHICDGKLGPMPFPLILGHEFVGRIEALGPGGARDGLDQALAVGDAVVSCVAVPCGTCASCRRGEMASCLAFGVTYVRPAAEAPHFHGGFAEYLIAGFRSLVRIPEGLDPRAVAAFPCGGPTILRAFAYAGGLSKEELVLVQGNGPLGLFAIAYAKAMGCRTICIGSAADARRSAATAEFAPDLFLDYRSTSPEDAVERVRSEAGRLGRGDGADVCIETSGNPAAFPLGLRLLRTRGRYVVPGQYSNRGEVSIPPHDITFRALRVIGSGQYTLGDIGAYLRFLTEHPALQATFAATVACYAVEDVTAAIADAAAGRTVKAAFSRMMTP